jgi:uncharacterized glyoxalase superfamily protein PhnB
MLPGAARALNDKEDSMATTTALKASTIAASLTVHDLQKSIRFYTEGLGFTIADEWKDGGELHGVMLKAGKGDLGISQDDFAKGRDRKKGEGMRLHIQTDQDIQALAQQVKGAGFRLDQEPGKLPWGPTGFSVTDPDGFKLTVSQPEK